MKELKSIKVYIPLSKYLAWFVFFGGANMCLIGALFYNYIFGRVRNPLSLIGLIVSFTIFTAIQVAIKYLFGRKLLIEGQDIRAKKWYGKWHKFALISRMRRLKRLYQMLFIIVHMMNASQLRCVLKMIE